MRDQVLLSLIEKRGGTKRIADACGVTTQAVSQWRRVPRRHVETVAAIFGIPADRLRPDAQQQAA